MKKSIKRFHRNGSVIAKRVTRIPVKLKSKLRGSDDVILSVDSPKAVFQDNRKLFVSGWIVSKKATIKSLRIINNNNKHEAKYGIRRKDVKDALPDIPSKIAEYSGFNCEFEFDDGELSIEVNLGRGYTQIFRTKVIYGRERLPRHLYNKDLANNYPEHVNLLSNRKTIYYEEESSDNFIREKQDPRAVAIYLPQFHPFAENDKAWGKGFTEWTNVTTGVSRYVGHQQPILPSDQGFYDLRIESNMLDQINLAKKYGIYGFCFYYYWFSGKKIMDMPIETFIKNKSWDFNFTICWANENWTKRWDGRDQDVIIAQKYLDQDPINFIKDVEHILLDKRYIKEGEKPVLMVYRASELKNPELYSRTWKDYFKAKHGIELHLVSFLSFDNTDPREYGFDAALDFAPISSFFKTKHFKNSKYPYIDVSGKLLDINFEGTVADYRKLATSDSLYNIYDFPTYQCVAPSWDNDARKKGKGFVFHNSSPDIYSEWLDNTIKRETKNKQSPLIFINAWNEWAEGAMLEPSMHLGHAVLKRTAEVLAKHSRNPKNRLIYPPYGVHKDDTTELAVIVHLYYIDLWDDIKQKLELVDDKFDIFISISENRENFIDEIKKTFPKAYVYVFPNRGRDVLPFLTIANKVRSSGYKKILKLHSKKSEHRKDGYSWFEDTLNNLLPDKEMVKKVISKLDDPNVGLVGPYGHLVSLYKHIGSNEARLDSLLTQIYGSKKSQKVLNEKSFFTFFGGTMFWLRTDAIDRILDLFLLADDFESEHEQIDGTIAHALERLFGVVAKVDGKSMYTVSPGEIKAVEEKTYDKKYKHAS